MMVDYVDFVHIVETGMNLQTAKSKLWYEQAKKMSCTLFYTVH